MENFERVAGEMLSYIDDKTRKMMHLLLKNPNSGDEAKFILCGISGCGKTRAVEEANKKLPADQQIAESHDMLSIKEPSQALVIFNDRNLRYVDSSHIGFDVVQKDLAKKLEADGIKVFWFDK